MSQVAEVGFSRAVYALSADPITCGHIDIVQRAAQCFTKVIVGIGQNPLKSYLFSLSERKSLAEKALAHLANVEVMVFEGLLVDFAYDQCATVIIRGVRSASDLEYEHTLHSVGASQRLGIDTHMLFADPGLSHISSSIVKAMQVEHGFIQDYVPPAVKSALEAKLSRQLVIGVTGDIASGKSTLCEALVTEGQNRGLPVHNIDLDVIGHEVLQGEGIAEPLYENLKKVLVERFGEGIIKDKRIDRSILADRVFGREQSRLLLNHIMEKPIAITLRRKLYKKEGVILLNGALLPDFGLMGLCNNRCILLQVDSEEQTRRLVARGMSKEQIEHRLGSQLRGEDKKRLICKSIQNSGYGKLWCFHSSKQAPGNLLDSILLECEEFAWS